MIFKRESTYYYEFELRGRRYRESTRQGNPRIARQMEAARRTQILKGELGVNEKPPAPAFQDFTTRFTDWVSTEKKQKPKTVTFYKDCVKQLLKYDKLRCALLDRIDEAMIADYIKWRTAQTRHYAIRQKKGAYTLANTFRPVAVASVNRELATLRRILNVARQWKEISAVPIIKLLPGEQTHERVLTHAEESLYLGAAPLLLRQFATVMLDTGCRPEEVCRMKWENVHLEPVSGSRYGYAHNPFGKTKRAKRNLPLTARVHAILSMRYDEAEKPKEGYVFPGIEEGHVPYSTIDSQHNRTLDKLNAIGPDGKKPENPVTPFRLYDLRHSFLTRLGEVNTDPYTIQKIAGHSSIVMSQRYVHPTGERVEDAFSRLESYNGGKSEPARPEVATVN